MFFRRLGISATSLLLISCGGSVDCTAVGGEAAVHLSIPANGQIVKFCVDGYDCVTDADASETSVGLIDDDVFAYEYQAIVQLDGEQIDFVGVVELEPLFPNGEDCERSGKFAELVVVDKDTIESR